MTSKWKKGRLQSAQELEESISQELADLGMLEHGMTFQDKKDLLNAVKLSQKSAIAEEEGRKTKSTSPLLHNGDNTEEDSSVSIKNDKCKEGSEDNIGQDILDNLSLTHTDCDSGNITQTKTTQHSGQTLDYVSDLSSVTHNLENNLKMKRSQVNSPNSSVTVSSKDSEVGSTYGENGNVQNGCENGETKTEVTSDNENVLIVLPASGPSKHSEISSFRRRKDDRERNIDVFSQCSSLNEKEFVRSCKSSTKVPFYFVPEGMDVRKYIAYFKCCVSQYYKNLSFIQKNSIEHLEWGSPITMDTSSVFASLRSSSSDGQGDSSRRYNFRDRYPKPKLMDLPSENSDDGEEDEEDSNDEDMFIPHFKKMPGIKLSAKRKNTSSSEALSTKKEKKECLSLQKTMDDDEILQHEGCLDSNAIDTTGEILERSFQKSRSNTPASRKRARKGRKLKQLQAEIQEEISEIIPEPDSSLASIIEPDIVIAECPPNESSPMLDEINPSLLSSKQRRLQHQAENIRQNRRKSEPRKNFEVVLIGEEVKAQPEEELEKVRCPICSSFYPASYIEEHASECNQYSPDNSTKT